MKIILKILALSVLLIGFSACSDDEDVPVGQSRHLATLRSIVASSAVYDCLPPYLAPCVSRSMAYTARWRG